MYVEQTQLDLTDQIGSVGAEKEIIDIFTVNPGPTRLYDFRDDVHLAITYELNRNLTTVRRKVYGILDFLGDLGGLAGAL
jgi:hypothetical protein